MKFIKIFTLTVLLVMIHQSGFSFVQLTSFEKIHRGFLELTIINSDNMEQTIQFNKRYLCDEYKMYKKPKGKEEKKSQRNIFFQKTKSTDYFEVRREKQVPSPWRVAIYHFDSEIGLIGSEANNAQYSNIRSSGRQIIFENSISMNSLPGISSDYSAQSFPSNKVYSYLVCSAELGNS